MLIQCVFAVLCLAALALGTVALVVLLSAFFPWPLALVLILVGTAWRVLDPTA